jgi:hypothetical protein
MTDETVKSVMYIVINCMMLAASQMYEVSMN